LSEQDKYKSAISELESILSELESSAVDVDQLSSRLTRASELVKFCRDRLTVVQTDVDEVLQQLDSVGADDASVGSGTGTSHDA
jgi:exodeoxyribonuclease VII small subunit